MERSISRRQSLQCTSRDGGEGKEEEPKEKEASREHGPPAPGGRNEGFLAGSVGDAAKPPKNIGEGDGDEFNSTGEGDRSRG